MPRSRTVRALAAVSAGIVGAGSVVCATLAYTHPSHTQAAVSSLTAVPNAGSAPRASEPPTGLLAWHAPTTPRPLVLSPRVVHPVRVVRVVRYVKAAAPRTRPRTRSRVKPRTTQQPPPSTTATPGRRTRRPRWQRDTSQRRDGVRQPAQAAPENSHDRARERDGEDDG